MNDPVQRLFFALWPAAALRKQLNNAVEPLRNASEGRAIPSENFHITLAFLDSVPVSKIPAVIKAARSVSFSAFELTLDCYGLFTKPKVAWYGSTQHPDALEQLVLELRKALSSVVSLRPERIYRPHLSTMRKQTALPDLAPPSKVIWQASDFVLVDSEYGPGHAIYTVLERFPAQMP
ncbi:MAG: RNA 2',3'-cyclic phosphodiesterase [Gammaproteobacteria bacterium]|nr:RNA 2',3'-cyclic phosphodiesterase [Gammaproteobacteria bacterium]